MSLTHTTLSLKTDEATADDASAGNAPSASAAATPVSADAAHEARAANAEHHFKRVEYGDCGLDSMCAAQVTNAEPTTTTAEKRRRIPRSTLFLLRRTTV